MYRYFSRLLLIFIFFTSFIAAQQDADDSIPPAHYAPDREFHMIHLDLNFHFNIEKKEVLGIATEKIVPLEIDYKTIHLDAADMNIKKASIGKKDLTFKYDGKILSINLDKPYSVNDTLTISIEYSTIPKKGIYFILPDSAYPNRTPQLWSQSESEDARYWFPCHDYPDDFSTSSLTATVPADWVVVANGLLKKEEENKKDRTKTFTWIEDKPHVVYLNSIVAGKYKILKAKWDDVPIYYYVEPEFVEDAKANFSHTPDILKYFSEVTGFHYAWQKLSLSGVSDFTEGGMENVSAITLTNTTFHDKNVIPLRGSTTDLVSHETAHQWFGDLLTCRTWGDSWLNEGFATYFEALYGEHAFGRDHFIYEMNKNHQLVITAEKQKRQPTSYNRYNSPDDIFNEYIYERGASLLHMLREMLGDDLFFKAIKHYVNKFQFQNVDSHDFENAVTEATGKNFYWFFDEWLYKGGHPVFDVDYNYDNANHKLTMNVAQTQLIDSLTPVYKMPVDILIVTPSGKVTKEVWVDSLKNTFVFDIPETPLMVNFDEDNCLLKEINFKKSVDELAYQLKNDSNVVGRVWAAGQLGKDSTAAAENALITALRSDRFWGVRSECSKALSGFENDDSRNALIKALDDKDPKVQNEVISSLANFKNEIVAGKLSDIFKTSKNISLKAAAVGSLADVDSAKAIPVVDEAINMNSYREIIRGAALDALKKLNPDEAYNAALKYSAYGNESQLRLHSIVVLSQTTKDLDATVKLLEKYTGDSYWLVRLVSINALGRLGDKDTIPFLEKIASGDSSFRVAETARRSIEAIKKRFDDKNKI